MDDLIKLFEDIEEAQELTMDNIINHLRIRGMGYTDYVSEMIENDTVGEALLSMSVTSEDSPLYCFLRDFSELEEEYGGHLFQNYIRGLNGLQTISSYNLYSTITGTFYELSQNNGIGMGTYLMLYNNLKKTKEEVQNDEFF